MKEDRRYLGRACPERSEGIQQFRNRAYDPATGTWIQEDPMGVAGGVNLYRFNNGNPVSFGDPLGLCPEDAGGDGKTDRFDDCPPGSSGWYANRIATGEGNHTLNEVGGALAACGESFACNLVLAVAGPVVSGASRLISGAGAAEAVGAFTEIANVTASGSRFANIGANLTAREFQTTLIANGYRVIRQTTGSNGPVTILSNGKKTYTIYTATTTGAASAQVTDAAGKILSKIRLSGF